MARKWIFRILRLSQEACLWILPASLVLSLGGSLLRPLSLVLLAGPPLLRLGLAIRDRFSVSYAVVSTHFSREAVIWLLSGVLGALQGRSWPLPAALACVITAVFLLRILRQEEEGILTRTSFALELTLALALCTACLVLSHPLVGKAVLSAVVLVLRLVLTPAALLLGFVIYGLLWLGIRFLQLLGIQRGEAELDPPDLTLGIFPEEELQMLNSGGGYAKQIFWGILIAAMIVGAAIWLKRRSRTQRAAVPGHVSGTETVRTRMENTSRAPERIPSADRSARTKVRKAYRRFLKELAKAGPTPRLGDTTLEIQERYVPDAMKEKAGRLRELYLKARYDMAAVITEEEAAEAAVIEKQLRDQA